MKGDCAENKRLRLLLLEGTLSGDERGTDSVRVSGEQGSYETQKWLDHHFLRFYPDFFFPSPVLARLL